MKLYDVPLPPVVYPSTTWTTVLFCQNTLIMSETKPQSYKFNYHWRTYLVRIWSLIHLYAFFWGFILLMRRVFRQNNTWICLLVQRYHLLFILELSWDNHVIIWDYFLCAKLEPHRVIISRCRSNSWNFGIPQTLCRLRIDSGFSSSCCVSERDSGKQLQRTNARKTILSRANTGSR